MGGNIVGGNPVEVTPMKVASHFSRGRDVQSGDLGPTLVTPWRRRNMLCCLEGQDRMACSKVSGSKPQREQDISAGLEVSAAYLLVVLFPFFFL